MFTKMNMKNEKGFTLIELMIVIAIIGILAAIAIPQFSAYRARSYNAAANTDVRNLMTAVEGYFVDNDNYPDVTGDNVLDLLDDYGFVQSAGVVIGDIVGDGSSYSIAPTWNSLSTSRGISYDVSGPGGTIRKQ